MDTMNSTEFSTLTRPHVNGVRQNIVLTYLQGQPLTARDLAGYLNVPVPSVRRTIQELRRAGFRINFASPNGVYRLG